MSLTVPLFQSPSTFFSRTAHSSYFAVQMAWSSALNFKKKHPKEHWSYVAPWIWSGSIWHEMRMNRFPHIDYNIRKSQPVGDFTICRWEIWLLPPVLIYSTILTKYFTEHLSLERFTVFSLIYHYFCYNRNNLFVIHKKYFLVYAIIRHNLVIYLKTVIGK